MKKNKLSADKRTVLGRKVKKLRDEGILPANVFGTKVKSQAIQLNKDDFLSVFKEAGETGLIDLKIGTSEKPVLISNIHIHPVTDKVLHVDFRQVNLKEKIEATVPFEVVGVSPADKSGIGVLVQLIDEITVKALPANLPEKLEVDVSKLDEVGKTLTLKDLKFDKTKIEIETDENTVIAQVEDLQKEEEVVVATETEETVEGEETTEGDEDKKVEDTKEASVPAEDKKEN